MPATRPLLSFALAWIVVAGCTPARSSHPDAAAPGGDDAAVSLGPDAGIGVDAAAPGCTSCPSGQICSAGACVSLPSGCPCPSGSYCDLASNTCIAGCVTNDDCAASEVCDTAARSCVAGCRSDDDCALGSICDATMHCAAGCRPDRPCPSGAYCHVVEPELDPTGTCEPTCSAPGDPVCGGDAYCGGDRCVQCGQDDSPSPEMPRIVDGGSSSFALVCPASDLDYFTAAIRCSGTCSGSVAVGWTIDVPTGLVPTCDYTVLQLGGYESRPSRLTGPTATGTGDRWVCEPVDETLFQYVSSEMSFQLVVGLSASGIVTVSESRLR